MNISPEALLFFPVLLFSIICHEAAHAYAAFKGGDDTARLMGRMSLNPLVHIDPVGTILIPILQLTTGFPLIGWAKPVPVNPNRFKSRSWDIVVSLAGVTANLALALVAVVLLKVLVLTLGPIPHAAELTGSSLGLFHWIVGNVLVDFILLNICLLVFNLIPIPPLDGSHVLFYFIRTRDSAAFRIFQFLERFGFVILMVLLVTGVLGILIRPVFNGLFLFLDWFL